MLRWGIATTVMLGCGRLDAIAPVDAAPDIEAPFRCDPTHPFGTPVPLTEINTPNQEDSFRLTPDELTAVFHRTGGWDAGVFDDELLITTRSSITAPFNPPTKIVVDAPASDHLFFYNVSITGDALSLFFECVLAGQDGLMCLATRPSVQENFGPVSYLRYPCSTADLHEQTAICTPYVRPDGLRMYLVTDGTESTGFYAADHASLDADFVLGPEARAGVGAVAIVTSDELTLFAGQPIQTATRSTVADSFGSLTPIDLGDYDQAWPTWISVDQCRLYFTYTGVADSDIYVATRH